MTLDATRAASSVPAVPPDGSVPRQFIASDGYVLKYRHWTPAAPVRGYIVALHGIQSHSGWYGHSSGRLAQAGYDVCFLDRRGSGLNEADRGHAASAARLINDVCQFAGDVVHERNREAPGTPVVLMGVSWGGKLAAVTAARRPDLFDAVALLYPGIRARYRPSRWQRMLLRFGRALGAVRKPVEIPLKAPSLFTDSAEWQEFIRQDPLALRTATVGFLNASVDLDDCIEALRKISRPVLMMAAGRDRIIDTPALRGDFDSMTAEHKTWIEYPNAAHTLEFEPDRDQFIKDLTAWLNGLTPRTERP